MRFPKGRTVGPPLWWRSLRHFLSPRRESGNKVVLYVLFSLRREKSTKRAPLKGKTHGFSLEKPFSSQCACLPLASLSRARLARVRQMRCQVGSLPNSRDGVGATPSRAIAQIGLPMLKCQPFGYGEARRSAEGSRANRLANSVEFPPNRLTATGVAPTPLRVIDEAPT